MFFVEYNLYYNNVNLFFFFFCLSPSPSPLLSVRFPARPPPYPNRNTDENRAAAVRRFSCRNRPPTTPAPPFPPNGPGPITFSFLRKHLRRPSLPRAPARRPTARPTARRNGKTEREKRIGKKKKKSFRCAGRSSPPSRQKAYRGISSYRRTRSAGVDGYILEIARRLCTTHE